LIFEVRGGRSFLEIKGKKGGSFDTRIAPSSAASSGVSRKYARKLPEDRVGKIACVALRSIGKIQGDGLFANPITASAISTNPITLPDGSVCYRRRRVAAWQQRIMLLSINDFTAQFHLGIAAERCSLCLVRCRGCRAFLGDLDQMISCLKEIIQIILVDFSIKPVIRRAILTP
jgi:hypothetical protein